MDVIEVECFGGPEDGERFKTFGMVKEVFIPRLTTGEVYVSKYILEATEKGAFRLRYVDTRHVTEDYSV